VVWADISWQKEREACLGKPWFLCKRTSVGSIFVV